MYKFFMLLVSLNKWLGIVLFPTIIGCMVGWTIYYKKSDLVGFGLGVLIALIGVFLGIKLAEKVWRSEKTSEFLDDIASPQTNEMDEESKH